jgi:hypothetical protein
MRIDFIAVCLILLTVVIFFFRRKYIKNLKFWQKTYYPESADCYICGIGKAYIDCDNNHLKEKV